MPRVFTAKAAKDYPDHGIKKGEVYYHWAFFRGPKMMSAKAPRPSQLTQTKMSTAYAAQEALEDLLNGATGESTTLEDIAEAVRECESECRGVADEYNESADNMEETFTGGSPQIDEAREKAEALESFADELDSAADDIEALDLSDYRDDANHEGEESLSGDVTWDDLTEEEKNEVISAAVELAQCPSLEV